jgi:large subunit ribosomal protein L4e
LDASRPLVSVYSAKNELTGQSVKLPAVFRAPIRTDIVQFVHTNLAKNKRQPYGVSREAGSCPFRTSQFDANDELSH